MTAARWLGALSLTIACQALAQAPTVDASATAVRAVPLPVLDNYGDVIAEDLIRATMRDGSRSLLKPILGAVIGGIVFASIAAPEHACDIYDPCTPQEEFYRDNAPKLGVIAGALIGAAFMMREVDRETAVELLRARPRTQRPERSP
jgi:hypothetical protein